MVRLDIWICWLVRKVAVDNAGNGNRKIYGNMKYEATCSWKIMNVVSVRIWAVSRVSVSRARQRRSRD